MVSGSWAWLCWPSGPVEWLREAILRLVARRAAAGNALLRGELLGVERSRPLTRLSPMPAAKQLNGSRDVSP